MRRDSDRIHPGLFRQPDISKSHIVFVYAGDIWLVAKEGGNARRLTREVGEEVFPRFNPDGDRIAYSAGAFGSRASTSPGSWSTGTPSS